MTRFGGSAKKVNMHKFLCNKTFLIQLIVSNCSSLSPHGWVKNSRVVEAVYKVAQKQTLFI